MWLMCLPLVLDIYISLFFLICLIFGWKHYYSPTVFMLPTFNKYKNYFATLGNWKFLQDLLELTPKKGVLFIIGDWNAKVGSPETPGVTGKFGLGMRNEAGQRLIEFCQENALVIANTLFQQEKTLHMDITRWSTPKSDWLYSLQPKIEKLYTVNKNKTGRWLWLRSWTPYCQIQT